MAISKNEVKYYANDYMTQIIGNAFNDVKLFAVACENKG